MSDCKAYNHAELAATKDGCPHCRPAFDPEKVDRGYTDYVGKFIVAKIPEDREFVRASDYDQLLALYRAENAERSKVILRDYMERLIEKYLREDREMEKIILAAGPHYTYRDKQRNCLFLAGEIEREHLYLIGYVDSSKRIREIRDRVYEEFACLNRGLSPAPGPPQ